MVDLVVYVIGFKTCAKRRRNGARNAEAFMAVVENVEEGKGGVVGDGRRGGGVY